MQTKGNIRLNCPFLNYENMYSNKRIWKIILCYLPVCGKSCSVSNFRINGILVKLLLCYIFSEYLILINFKMQVYEFSYFMCFALLLCICVFEIWCAKVLLFVIYHVLVILYSFVTYCFDWIAQRNSALSMMNSTFNLTCVGDGSVLYIYMYVCMYVCMYVFICVCARACVCVGGKTSILISEYHNCFDYDHHCKRCQRNTSLCYLLEQFI